MRAQRAGDSLSKITDYLLNLTAGRGCVEKSVHSVAPNHVQRSFHQLTCMIETPAGSPKLRGKQLGRAFGTKQVKRKLYPVVIKTKNTAEQAAA